MPASALVDTGAIVALLDPTDSWHEACAAAYPQFRLPLVTSEAVLTEVFHLAPPGRRAMEAAWKFIRSGAIVVASIADSELPLLHSLMSRYWDHPMDFADASLVHLGNRELLSTVFTIDHVDFETYRLAGNRKFRVVPGKSPH